MTAVTDQDFVDLNHNREFKTTPTCHVPCARSLTLEKASLRTLITFKSHGFTDLFSQSGSLQWLVQHTCSKDTKTRMPTSALMVNIHLKGNNRVYLQYRHNSSFSLEFSPCQFFVTISIVIRMVVSVYYLMLLLSFVEPWSIRVACMAHI